MYSLLFKGLNLLIDVNLDLNPNPSPDPSKCLNNNIKAIGGLGSEKSCQANIKDLLTKIYRI